MYIMVRPGLRRLQEAQRVKVQPNKAGTSVNQNKSVVSTGFIKARGALFSELGTIAGSTASTKSFTPSYTATQKLEDRCCKNKK